MKNKFVSLIYVICFCAITSVPAYSQLSGTYTVGTGGDFSTLRDAVTALMTGGSTSDVVFNVISDINEGSGEINILPWSNSQYSLTIKPQGGNWNISGSIPANGNGTISYAPFICVRGADNITFGDTTGTYRLGIKNESVNTRTYTGTLILKNLTDDALQTDGPQNILITYCNIYATVWATTSHPAMGIRIEGKNASNITISHCNLFRGGYGIYSYAYNATSPNLAGQINVLYNNIGVDTTEVGPNFFGISLYYANAPIIKGNVIQNLISNYTSPLGIVAQGCNDAIITENIVHDLRYYGNLSYVRCAGIYIRADADGIRGNNNIITNNLVYNIIGYGSTTSNDLATGTSLFGNPVGIFIQSGTGHKIANNTVHLFGTPINTTGITYSACLFVASATAAGPIANNLTVLNNTFVNEMTTPYTGGTSGFYNIFIQNNPFSTINYNDYWTNGTFCRIARKNTAPVGIYSTLLEWQTFTTQDNNSLFADPLFTDAPLNYIPLDDSPLVGAGTPLTYVTTDIIGQTRSAYSPTIGAYEVGGFSLIYPDEDAAFVPAGAIFGPTEFSWEALPEATYYQIQVSTSPEFDNLIIDENIDAPATTFTTESLELFSMYYWRAKAFNDDGELTDWTRKNRFTTTGFTPTLVTPADEEIDVPLSPRFNWSVPESFDPAAYNYQIVVYKTSVPDVPVYDNIVNYFVDYCPNLALVDNTEYGWKMRALQNGIYGPWTEENTFTTLGYCNATATCIPNLSESIVRVEFNTIDNISDCCPVDGPSDFTNISTNISRGESYAITVNCISSELYECAVWFDWNQNGDFYDDGEYYPLTPTDEGDTVYTGVVLVPFGAELGYTRMRVRLTDVLPAEPCGPNVYGDIEDYNVRVRPVPPVLTIDEIVPATYCQYSTLTVPFTASENSAEPGNEFRLMLNTEPPIILASISEYLTGDYTFEYAIPPTIAPGEYTLSVVSTYPYATSQPSGAIQIIQSPEIYTIYGGGAYCQGSNGITIGSTGSQAGIRYNVYIDGVFFDWLTTEGGPYEMTLPLPSGVYTIKALNTETGCEVDMLGSATVVLNPLLPVVSATPTGGGIEVENGVAISWEAAQCASSYLIKLADNAELTAPILEQTVTDMGILPILVENLQPNMTYYYQITTFNGEVQSVSPMFSFTTVPSGITQNITVPQGWSIISTNLTPNSLAMTDIWGSLVSNLVIIKDAAGSFWIPPSTGELSQWNPLSGYHVYASQAMTLPVVGFPIELPYTINMPNAGWYLVSYLPQQAMQAPQALSSIVSKMILAKNAMGEIYCPAFGVNTLENGEGTMIPGKGYYIYVASPAALEYSEAPDSRISVYGNSYGQEPQPKRWQTVSRQTNNNATLVLVTDLPEGTEIGAFTSGGMLAGSGVVRNGRAAVTLFGDDASTLVQIDGAREGETLYLRSYFNGATSDVVLSEVNELTKGGKELSYQSNGIFFARSASSEAATEAALRCSPNPFGESATVEFSLDEESLIELGLYSIQGELVKTICSGTYPAGSNSLEFSSGSLPSGVYNLILKAGDVRRQIKVVITK
jgi:hypothetical protein